MHNRTLLPRWLIVDGGTTLVELLVMISLLALVAIPILVLLNPFNTIRKSHDAKRIADITLLSQAIEQYIADNNNMPPDTSLKLRQSNLATPSANAAKSNGSGWIPVDLSKYIEKLPVDPINSPPYVYRYYRNGYTYKIDTKLEYYTGKMSNTVDGGNDNCHYEIGSGLTSITLPQSC